MLEQRRVGDAEGDSHDAARLQERETGENFPVALRWLPADLRTHLHAVYAVARTIDDIGDAPGDRTAELEKWRTDLARVWTTGRPTAPVLRRLAPTVRACDLSQKPFQHLVEANLMDQRVSDYATIEDLLGYCRLSADPVGRIVLAVVGAETPSVTSFSDQVCTALQLLEHWQDVAEDRRRGRVYLPRADLEAFGVEQADLDAAVASPALRSLIAFETDRAAAMLDAGLPVVDHLRGWARVAVAGYVAGGYATVRALRRTGGDVLSRTATPRTVDVAGRLLSLLSSRSRAR